MKAVAMSVEEARRKAERILLEHEVEKRYVPIDIRALLKWIVKEAG